MSQLLMRLKYELVFVLWLVLNLQRCFLPKKGALY